MEKNTLLIIGSIPYKNRPSSIGGTTVLMQRWIDYLNKKNINYFFISCNKFGFKGASVINFFYVVLKLFYLISRSDVVVVNVASNGAFVLSPVLYIISKIFRRKFVFRMFGGNFIQIFNKISKFKKKIALNTIIKANLVLVETKEILNFIKYYSNNVYWFPNTRELEYEINKERSFSKRFVFISHVKKTKGINEIIETAENLSDDYVIDIYGPLIDISKSDFINKRVNYKGVLNPNDVIQTLDTYDFLLLPTYHNGEGYPGIIIEAYSLGIPVITTNWNAIPEIVVDGKTGFLIEHKNSQALTDVIKNFNPNMYSELTINAYKQFKIFDSKTVHKTITDKILKL